MLLHLLVVFCRLSVIAALLLGGSSARANVPGGIIALRPNVRLTDNGNGTVNLANGLVTALINTSTGQILQLTYLGIQVTDNNRRTNGAFYWQGGDQIGGEQIGANCTYTVIASPESTSGAYAEISLLDHYTNHPATADCADADFHFSLFRGSPGLYVTEILSRPAAYPAGSGHPFSFTCKLGPNIFDWLSQDTGRNTLMPSVADLNAAHNVEGAPKEVKLLTTGVFAGQFDCKYNYSGQLGSLNVTGWSSTTRDIGIWSISPSHEYFSGGPLHRELLSQMTLINNPFDGGHFGFHPDLAFAAGETWTKVYGPIFIYFNHVDPGSAHPSVLLFADARAQAAAEQAAWPYAWFKNPGYIPESGRGTVTGKIIIADPGNPNASGAGLWVGLAQAPPTQTANADFQFFAKNYQYWVKSGPDGRFTIPHVVAGGNYTLFAFGPGAIGLFQSQVLPGDAPPVALSIPALPFSVNITAGASLALGNITWIPSRVAPTVFEIGVPDRDSTEFRHGDDYWHGDPGTAAKPAVNWAPFLNYATDFPGGLVYTVGQSLWARDWNYAQPTVRDPLTGNLVGTTQKIYFNLPQAPAAGAPASLYFAFASDFQGPVIVTVNHVNVTTPATGFAPAYSANAQACDAMIRLSSQGVFCDYRLNFSGNNLHAGLNEIDLTMRRGGYFSNSALYDYIRLELAGYVPPPPATVTARLGRNLVHVSWPSVPGATSYNLLRSTVGGNYQLLAQNLTGPVTGSTAAPVAYTDATAHNDTAYAYVVQSVNPTGASPNSTPAPVAPLASIPAIPATPMATK